MIGHYGLGGDYFKENSVIPPCLEHQQKKGARKALPLTTENWPLRTENCPQYFGILGSIRSAHAVMPPVRFRTFVNPACFRNATALALRPPILQ